MSTSGRTILAFVAGSSATLGFYLVLAVLQIANADNACESYPQTVPGADFDDVRGIGFENSYLNLGGSCTYRMDDGSVVHTREPGWWFSGSVAGCVVVFAAFVAGFARWKGHLGALFGLATLFAPPLGLSLAIAAPRRASG